MIDKQLADNLRQRALDGDRKVLKSQEFRSLYDQLKSLPDDQRGNFGKQVNDLRLEILNILTRQEVNTEQKQPIDLSAPFDVNAPLAERPRLLAYQNGSVHPLMSELDKVLDIFYRMGFNAIESREIDDEFHMFSSLNFPEGHPARDDYDTFLTEQADGDDNSFIAPAHTSSMQHRVLSSLKVNLAEGKPIAVVIPGRVFRNEDLDTRHEHTFYQLEGVYVDEGVNAGNLIATLKSFLDEYYGQDLEIRTQPYYFPFTEPSFEFALSCPFCGKEGCQICSFTGWIELLGCGMIHPHVLRQADIDVNKYTGFAWGFGIERLVMMKFGIEDIRHFESGKLEFLRQFK
ncbi:MAG TPA: phenylalanine--tRNA ligase subunit alpha [Candidatus Saccharimonadales bacterium]|nr:phenylalanine--tRNA ligase subunit alpha [Candidatus Saccharimonadales bacterium]